MFKTPGKTNVIILICICLLFVTSLMACSKNQDEEFATEGLKFVLNEEGSAYTISQYDGTDTRVVIPSKYNGKSVTAIGEYAFFNHGNLASITIPDSVTEIGTDAFLGCLIRKATVPMMAVSHFSLDVLDILEITSGERSIEARAFDGALLLTTISISNVYEIKGNAFYGCASLTSIALLTGVKKINRNAFYGCNELSSLSISDSVDTIDAGAFSGCKKLANVTIDDNNQNYCSVNNMIYNKEQTVFLFCSRTATKCEILEGVKTLDTGAFSDCSSLTSISIPSTATTFNASLSSCPITTATLPACACGMITSSLTRSIRTVTIISGDTLKASAFSGCEKLTNITLPSSLTKIEKNAFYNCKELTSIKFQGTKEQWNSISKGQYWNYNTGAYKIKCTDGNIEK